MSNINMKRDFYLDVYTDIINIMDHMHISGNGPSSVILKVEKWWPKSA